MGGIQWHKTFFAACPGPAASCGKGIRNPLLSYCARAPAEFEACPSRPQAQMSFPELQGLLRGKWLLILTDQGFSWAKTHRDEARISLSLLQPELVLDPGMQTLLQSQPLVQKCVQPEL